MKGSVLDTQSSAMQSDTQSIVADSVSSHSTMLDKFSSIFYTKQEVNDKQSVMIQPSAQNASSLKREEQKEEKTDLVRAYIVIKRYLELTTSKIKLQQLVKKYSELFELCKHLRLLAWQKLLELNEFQKPLVDMATEYLRSSHVT